MGKVARIYIGNGEWAELVGLQGPQGTQGIQGVQGPAGPVGPKVAVFSNEPPASPEPGDVWFDADGTMTLGGSVAVVSDTAPGAPVAGDLWVDSAQNQFKRWTGASWQAVGASWNMVANLPMTSLDGWSVPAGSLGTWTLDAGYIRSTVVSTGASDKSRFRYDPAGAALTTAPWGAAVRVECRFVSGAATSTQRAGIYCGWNGTSVSGGYFLCLETDGAGKWNAYHESDSLAAGTATDIGYDIGYGTWFSLAVVNLNGTAYAYVNDVYVNSWASAPQQGGYLGLHTYEAVVDYRNLRAWNRIGVPW